ncbi:MAG: ADP-ribosylglycohydrolase family protein [Clostridia bacterium]|nr:ADP-ribosylglycohydrolase family protein [Clostridia bacterium]
MGISEKDKVFLASERELLDKLEGGWIGKMAGVAWGTPTEFCYAGRMIPENELPVWTPEMINTAFTQDDMYAQVPFIDAMAAHGVNCPLDVFAEYFMNTRFALWHANGMARRNLKRGIPAPESGAYYNNYHCDDIDWQIDCDFLGMIYPGDVARAAGRAFEIGHIMNYGDGVFGGVFVTALHAAAFDAGSVEELCARAVSAIPGNTLFRALLDDVTEWHRTGVSFEECWQMLEDKWSACALCPELPGKSNIDAKFNSGYVLMGLLYGEGDFEKSVKYALICGQDSDCDPSTVGGVLGNYLGASGIPDRYKSALDRTGRKYAFTDYTFEDAVNLNFRLMKEQFALDGARFADGVWERRTGTDTAPLPPEQWPDGVYVYADLSLEKNTLRVIEITPFAKNEKIVSVTVETGDGTVFIDAIPAFYTYEKPGEYLVTVTVKGDRGGERRYSEAFAVKEAENAPEEEIVVCSVTSPCGGGARDARIIANGVIPSPDEANDRMQYDTYILGDPHGNPPRAQYVGYVFRKERTVTAVDFTEGNHFGNGGWFASGSLEIQVFRAGGWERAGFTASPSYPGGNAMRDFLPGYQTYRLTLDAPCVCEGVRLYGVGGGSAGFISVCELDVH